VVTASDDRTARIWDLEGREIAVFRESRSLLPSAVFSPTGDRVLTVCGDMTVRLRDLSGRELAQFGGQQDWYRTAVLSPDGARVLAASGELPTAHLWANTRAELLRLLDERATRDFTPEERVKYADLLEPVPASER
jgi:WD40 repeat protein